MIGYAYQPAKKKGSIGFVIADFHVLGLFIAKNMILAIKKFPSVTRR
jgi:hypothetical protein